MEIGRGELEGAGIDMTGGPEECFYALKDCKANAVVVESQMQLDKILQVVYSKA